jgi:hypothetical protein
MKGLFSPIFLLSCVTQYPIVLLPLPFNVMTMNTVIPYVLPLTISTIPPYCKYLFMVLSSFLFSNCKVSIVIKETVVRNRKHIHCIRKCVLYVHQEIPDQCLNKVLSVSAGDWCWCSVWGYYEFKGIAANYINIFIAEKSLMRYRDTMN